MALRAKHARPQGGRTRLCGRPHEPRDVRLSKTLAYALRHGASALSLDMTPSGFVSVTHVLALPLFESFSERDVVHVVRYDAKNRFTLTTSGDDTWIRANQGHSLPSVQDEELLVPVTDPRAIGICVHGTFLRVWDAIWDVGLSRMQRNHIHFVAVEPAAAVEESGLLRASCNLWVYIDVVRAVQDGIKFYTSSNKVVLSPGKGDTGLIDRRYFVRAVTREGTVVYERNEGG